MIWSSIGLTTATLTREKDALIRRLSEALEEVKTLSGLLPYLCVVQARARRYGVLESRSGPS